MLWILSRVYQHRQETNYSKSSNVLRVAKKNSKLFKKLDDSDIWEFRCLYNKIAYRLFAFWDTKEETLVIATHGIIKKTQKTPPKEIVKAERIRLEYFKDKGEKI